MAAVVGDRDLGRRPGSDLRRRPAVIWDVGRTVILDFGGGDGETAER
jgi:hypothetical protein